MAQAGAGRPVVVALWVNAALLAGIGVLLLTRGGSILPVAAAQNQPAIGGGAGVFVVPAQFSPSVWGCYLLDVDTQNLIAYQYAPGERQLRLAAARSYRYDRRLTNFNTGSPSPREVAELLDREARPGRAGTQPAGGAIDSVPPSP